MRHDSRTPQLRRIRERKREFRLFKWVVFAIIDSEVYDAPSFAETGLSRDQDEYLALSPEHLWDLRQTLVRHLQILQEKLALLGIHAPPHITLEIEDIDRQLKLVEQRLAELRRGNALAGVDTSVIERIVSADEAVPVRQFKPTKAGVIGFVLVATLLLLLGGFFIYVDLAPTPVQPSAPVLSVTPTTAPGSCPATLALGVMTQCSFEYAGKTDEYLFEVDTAGRVFVLAAQADIPGNDGVDPTFTVIDSAGTHIKSCDPPEALPRRQSCVLPTAGTYKLRVKSSGQHQTGVYRVYAQSLKHPAQAGTIGFGATIQGRIETPDNVMTYVFDGKAGDAITLEVKPDHTDEHDRLGPEFQVYGSDGEAIEGCAASDAWIARTATACTLPSDGQYTILLTDRFFGSKGPFTLQLTKE